MHAPGASVHGTDFFPRDLGNGGHMQLKLYKQTGPSPGEQPAAGSATPTMASPEPEKRRDSLGLEADGDVAAAILYGDSCEMVAKKIR